jgi:hypothetical protein
VQGIGSVLAIIAAVGIAWWQRREDHRRADLGARQEERRAIQVAFFYCGKLLWCLEDHVQACAAQNRRDLERARAVLRDIAGWAGSIGVERLPFDALAAFFTARRIAAVAQQHWDELGSGQNPDYDHWRRAFEELREQADDALAKLFDQRIALDDSPGKHSARKQTTSDRKKVPGST